MLVLAIGDFHIPDRAIDLPAKFKKLLVPGKISQVLCLGNITTSQSTLEFLKNLSPDFQHVKGEYDENSNLPLSLIITHGSLRIGFTNGYTIVPRGDPLSLLTMARQMNVDVLIWGGTHRVEAYTLEGKFFINPGSATGAFSTDWPDLEESTEYEAKKVNAEADGQVNDDEKKEDKTETKNEETNNKQDVEEEDNSDDDEGINYDTLPSFTLLDIQGSVITLYIYTYINGEVKVDKVSYRKCQQQ